ncbi:MAG TPA: hypothetical protein VGS62_07000 [Streptosporangiaceae bacterium]|nr:hypothetical protein [Streptosporangiaceae bacterium]
MRSARFRLSIAAAVAMAATSLALGSGALTQAGASTSRHVTNSLSRHMHINCANSTAFCTEVANSDEVFGHYVGHDEPSALFYSHKPGSGNHMSYNVTLPVDPSASNPNSVNKSFAFELSGADWFGMAMCDTQSYPEQVKTCPPDSDMNILDPAVSPKHVGEAFMEMQFYPPGWVPWPTWAVAVGASSCSKTQWCAALNIDSLSLNGVTGQANNQTCLHRVGEEYLNFAFITKSGKSQAPANPVDSTLGTFTPSSQDLFMNPGDHLTTAFKDTANGLKVTITDHTTGQTGSMTASKANGFAQVKFDPNGTSCDAIPYNFHPMYNTSSTKTRVTWAAHTYNVAFDSEIGHFQFCTGPAKVPATPFGLLPDGSPTSCPSSDNEGRGLNAEPTDGEDIFCFPGSEALLYKVQGCTFTNSGFDGASYQKLWPNGNTMAHPTPFQFTSPKTGPNYSLQYAQAAFEADLPAVEPTCDPFSGNGCTLIPQTDSGQPATFYPFFSTTKVGGGGCKWQFGNDIPGEISDFGQNGEYGTMIQSDYTAQGGSSFNIFQNFRNIFPNPCPQT